MIKPIRDGRLMQDPISGYWVITAPGRSKKPETRNKDISSDPFTASNIKHEKVLKTYGQGQYRFTVLENKYPIFKPAGSLKGRQEIVVEGNGKVDFVDFSISAMSTFIQVMYDRCKKMRRDPLIKYMIFFKNCGFAAGASQSHAHSQVFGLSFIPRQVAETKKRREKFIKKIRQSAHDFALAQATAERLIYADRKVIAYTPNIARLPYEVRITTRRTLDNVTLTSKEERESIAKALFSLMPFLRNAKIPFNLYCHDTFQDKHEHFEIILAPRLNIWAGFELDTGIMVNNVTAEKAAEEYKKAIK